MNIWTAKPIRRSSMYQNGTYEFTYEILRDGEIFFPEFTIICRPDERATRITERLNDWKMQYTAAELFDDEQPITV